MFPFHVVCLKVCLGNCQNTNEYCTGRCHIDFKLCLKGKYRSTDNTKIGIKRGNCY